MQEKISGAEIFMLQYQLNTLNIDMFLVGVHCLVAERELFFDAGCKFRLVLIRAWARCDGAPVLRHCKILHPPDYP